MNIEKCYATYVANKERQRVVDAALVVLDRTIIQCPDIKSALLKASLVCSEELQLVLCPSELEIVMRDLEYKYFNSKYLTQYETVARESKMRLRRDIALLPWHLSILPKCLKVKLCAEKIIRLVCHCDDGDQPYSSCSEETLLRCGFFYAIHRGFESDKLC